MLTRIRRVTLHNLFAFADLDIEVPDTVDVIALVGENRSGKSSFMEAILFVLTGEVRHGRSDTIVRRGRKPSAKDPAYGEVMFATDTGTATIKRGRAGKELLLEVRIDGELVASGAQAEGYIRENLLWGRSPADLMATAFARTGDVHRLSEIDPADRKALMMSWYPQLDPWPTYRKTVRDKITNVEATLERVAGLSEAAAADAVKYARNAEMLTAIGVVQTREALFACKTDVERTLAVAAGQDQSARIREIAGILRDAEQAEALRAKLAGVDAEGLQGRHTELALAVTDARMALDELKAEAAKAEGRAREIAALERLMEDAARLAAMKATWADYDLAGLTAEAQEAETELASRKAVQAEIVGEARAAKDNLDRLRGLWRDGFSGECPVDHKDCPRKAEINGDGYDAICEQYRDAQAKHDTAQANLANVNEAVRESEGDVKDARDRLAAFNNDAIEAMRLTAAGADRDAESIRDALRPLRDAHASAYNLPARTLKAEQSVTAAEQALTDCKRVIEQRDRDVQEFARLTALVGSQDLGALRQEQAQAKSAQDNAAHAQRAVDQARAALAQAEADHAAANREAGTALQRLAQAEAELARVQQEIQRSVKTRALLARLMYVERMASPDGIPAIVLENLIADVEARANGVLKAMRSPFEIRFAFESETSKKETVCQCGEPFAPRATRCTCGRERGMQKSNTLDLRLVEDGEEHAFSEDSGAGRAMASLAIRLGVARSMGMPFAFLDEAADAMDARNRAKFAGMLGGLGEAGFTQCWIVSHHEDIKSVLPTAIDFKKVNGVSHGRWA